MRNISAIAIAMIALSITSALPAGAVNEGVTPLTQQFSWSHTGPVQATVDTSYSGIGGPGPTDPDADFDCLDNGDTDVGTEAVYGQYPSVVLKVGAAENEIAPDTGQASPEVTELCLAVVERLPLIGQCADPMAIGVSEGCDVTYATSPQKVGVGRVRAYLNQSITSQMSFDDDWHALVDSEMMTCRVANPRAASTQITSTRNRGLVGLDAAVPSEQLRAVLDPASCVDWTAFLNLPNAGPGVVDGGLIPVAHPTDAALDLDPGLYAVCIATTARHVNNFTLVTLQDTTWFWVDSAGNSFSFRDLWGDPAKWDGENSNTVSFPTHCGTGPNGIGPVPFPL